MQLLTAPGHRMLLKQLMSTLIACEKKCRCKAQQYSLADLMEHVLETEGDAYLKTPDDELSFLVRSSIDTHASVGIFAALTVALLWKLSRVFARSVMGGPGKHRSDLLSLLIGGRKKRKKSF